MTFSQELPSDDSPGARRLEWLTLLHVSVLVIATTWGFGGQIWWIRTPLSLWGSLGLLITAAAALDPEARRHGWLRPFRWLWPLAGFNALVLLACLNPSLREIRADGESLWAHAGGHPWWPSTARPDLALGALWLFDALWLSCFNVVLAIRRRRTLRLLLLIVALNAGVLAVFGTLQKLAHSPGLFFGTVPSPQSYFFSTFIYHNHWGAAMLLMIGTAIGLTWHHGRRRDARGFFHTPATGLLLLVLLLAVTVPLSGSRSSTLLGLVLLLGAFVHWLVRLVAARGRETGGRVRPVAGAFLVLGLILGASAYLGRDVLESRLETTQQQVAAMRNTGSIGDRARLYRNTWEMAQEKPWFGWGMASYPQIFSFVYSSRIPRDKLPIFYADAHSDWLQSLAEHGRVGTTLLGALALVPLVRLRRRHLGSPLPAYLLAGCLLVVLYAWVEFPFGNVAVVLLWWLCFFTAVQSARLEDRAGQPAS